MSDKSCFIRHVRCHVKFKNSPEARRQSRCDRFELSEMPLNNICDCYTVPKSHDFGYPLILILSVVPKSSDFGQCSLRLSRQWNPVGGACP